MSVVIYIQDTGKEVAGCQAGGFFSLLRSFGIANAVDYVINWADRASGHAWNVLFDKQGKRLMNSWSMILTNLKRPYKSP